jgi:GGDEF domain-containing protein
MEPLLSTFALLSINIKLSPVLALPILLASVLGLLLLWERRKIRRVIEQFVSLASHAAIPTYRSVLPELSNELARARRTQRPMSVMVLALETDSELNSVDKPKRMSSRLDDAERRFRIEQIPAIALIFPQISYILRNTVRKSDIVACGPAPNEFVVVLAETAKTQATPFLDRFHELIASSGLTPLRTGVAEFPTEGLTIEDLVSNARASSKYAPPSQKKEAQILDVVPERGFVASREAV